MVNTPLPALYYICKFDSIIILSPYHEVDGYHKVITEKESSLQEQYRIIKLLLSFFVTKVTQVKRLAPKLKLGQFP